MMAFAPIVIGVVGSFIAGYITSQYTSVEECSPKIVDNTTPTVRLFTDAIAPNNPPIPTGLTLELNSFDKTKLKIPKQTPHSPKGMIHDLQTQLFERREYIKNEELESSTSSMISNSH
jgi:hypothetical protein